jgi:hypothetical protein
MEPMLLTRAQDSARASTPPTAMVPCWMVIYALEDARAKTQQLRRASDDGKTVGDDFVHWVFPGVMCCDNKLLIDWFFLMSAKTTTMKAIRDAKSLRRMILNEKQH